MPERFRAVHPNHRNGYFAAPHARGMGRGSNSSDCARTARNPDRISLSPIQTEEGTLVSSAIRDITERKASRAADAGGEPAQE